MVHEVQGQTIFKGFVKNFKIVKKWLKKNKTKKNQQQLSYRWENLDFFFFFLNELGPVSKQIIYSWSDCTVTEMERTQKQKKRKKKKRENKLLLTEWSQNDTLSLSMEPQTALGWGQRLVVLPGQRQSECWRQVGSIPEKKWVILTLQDLAKNAWSKVVYSVYWLD